MRQLYDHILIPQAVYREIEAGAGRACYTNLMSIPVTGTLGLLLKAKQQGLIPTLTPLLDELTTFLQ